MSKPTTQDYYHSLLRQLVIADFKLKFQGSALGLLWSFIKPLLLFGVLYVVFSFFVRLGDAVDNYALLLLVGIVIWSYFSEATKSGLMSIVARAELIRKVYFPQILIVIASGVNAGINFLISLIVVAIFSVVAAITFSATWLLLPIILTELFILTLGIALWLSALYVRWRDFSHLWDVALQISFYATPILYPVSVIPDRIQKFVFLNPLAQIIQDFRAALVGNESTITATDVLQFPFVLIPYLLPIIIVLSGYYFFKSREKSFAEDV